MDPIDRAIASSAEPSPHVEVQVKLPTGRAVAMLVPVDLTLAESFAVIGFVTNGLGKQLEAARASRRAPNLVIARGGIPTPGRD